MATTNRVSLRDVLDRTAGLGEDPRAQDPGIFSRVCEGVSDAVTAVNNIPPLMGLFSMGEGEITPLRAGGCYEEVGKVG